MKLWKEIIVRTHELNNSSSIIQENIMSYIYDTKEEKEEHSKVMQEDGYKDIGQIKENFGTIMSPDYVWIGRYHKYSKVREEDNVET